MQEFIPIELNEKLVKEIYESLANWSISIIERTVINNIIESINPKLMLKEEELRFILINAIKIFREKTKIPLQKLALLEKDKRERLILSLKNSIVESFIPIIKGKKRKQVKMLNAILTDYFSKYL